MPGKSKTYIGIFINTQCSGQLKCLVSWISLFTLRYSCNTVIILASVRLLIWTLTQTNALWFISCALPIRTLERSAHWTSHIAETSIFKTLWSIIKIERSASSIFTPVINSWRIYRFTTHINTDAGVTAWKGNSTRFIISFYYRAKNIYALLLI